MRFRPAVSTTNQNFQSQANFREISEAYHRYLRIFCLTWESI